MYIKIYAKELNYYSVWLPISLALYHLSLSQ